MSDLKMTCLSDVTPQAVEWLWYPYLPFGKITIMQGDPGEGKTMLMLSIIALLTRGECLYDQPFPNDPCICIYQTAEDGVADTIVPRLINMGADLTKVLIINEEQKQLSFVDKRIEEAIVRTGARLLVLDPLQAYIGAGLDMHRANEVRPAMHALSDVAQRTGCAIVLIGHMNKTKGVSSLYRGLGSIDISGAARSILLVRQPVKDNSEVYLAQVKASVAPIGNTLMFERTDDGLEFAGVSNLTADQVLGMKDESEEGADPQDGTKVMEAIKVLEDLAAQCDRMPSNEVLAICLNRGIRERSLRAAKDELGIKSVRHGKNWDYDFTSIRHGLFSSS